MALEMEQVLKGVKGIKQSENQRLKMASKLSSKWEVQMGRERKNEVQTWTETQMWMRLTNSQICLQCRKCIIWLFVVPFLKVKKEKGKEGERESNRTSQFCDYFVLISAGCLWFYVFDQDEKFSDCLTHRCWLWLCGWVYMSVSVCVWLQARVLPRGWWEKLESKKGLWFAGSWRFVWQAPGSSRNCSSFVAPHKSQWPPAAGNLLG